MREEGMASTISAKSISRYFVIEDGLGMPIRPYGIHVPSRIRPHASLHYQQPRLRRLGMASWRCLLATMVVLILLFASGCAGARRENIRPDHGEAYTAWFQAQQLATKVGPAEGLDSEEAAAIHGLYRSMLRGDSRRRTRDESPVILLPEQRYERSR